MAVSYVASGAVASGSNSGSGTATVTANLPSGWAENDIHILQITTDSSTALPTVSGYTLIYQLGGTSVFWRRAQAGDTGPTYTASPGFSLSTRAIISGFRGAIIASSPIEGAVTGTYTPGTFQNVVCPYVNVTNAGSMILSTGAYSSGTLSFVSPFTNCSQIASSFNTGTTAYRASTTAGNNTGGSFSTSFYGNAHFAASFVIVPDDGVAPSKIVNGSLNVAGTWMSGTPYVRRTGSWVEPTQYQRVGGFWRVVHGSP